MSLVAGPGRDCKWKSRDNDVSRGVSRGLSRGILHSVSRGVMRTSDIQGFCHQCTLNQKPLYHHIDTHWL